MGKYIINLYLTDNYKWVETKIVYFFAIEIDIPERPFHIYAPKNKAPKFMSKLSDEEQNFDIGLAWEYLLPVVFDFDGDPVLIEIRNLDTKFVQAELLPVPRLFITKGSSTAE